MNTDLVEQARQLRLKVEEFEKQILLVRGTKDDVYEGDVGTNEEFTATVHGLIAAHPLTFREILKATGARDNRIKGALLRLQREGVPVLNLGTQAKALWFAPSPEVLERLERVICAKHATEIR